MQNFNIKSKSGFTLIELLVVIGILAVLAAIAIPSVAGLIDRANVSADNTNCDEMTNAVERFVSEYELYCQDIANGTLDINNLDAAQGRVYNVTGATTRGDITKLESTTGLNGVQLNKDTKYPTNPRTISYIAENYMKTSSSTFDPKQSDMSFWYSPDCGTVVVATTDSTIENKNNMIISGKDAKGKELDPDEKWINLSKYYTSLKNFPSSDDTKILSAEYISNNKLNVTSINTNYTQYSSRGTFIILGDYYKFVEYYEKERGYVEEDVFNALVKAFDNANPNGEYSSVYFTANGTKVTVFKHIQNNYLTKDDHYIDYGINLSGAMVTETSQFFARSYCVKDGAYLFSEGGINIKK